MPPWAAARAAIWPRSSGRRRHLDAWAATTTGRVFISKNVDAEPAGAVTWTRLDDDSPTTDPNRFVSSIYVDPANPNHAWISYSGFSSQHAGHPGPRVRGDVQPGYRHVHVGRSLVDMATSPSPISFATTRPGTSTPQTTSACCCLAAGTTSWVPAAPGMPNVEVAGLTIVPGARILYAATHGLGAWRLNLG